MQDFELTPLVFPALPKLPSDGIWMLEQLSRRKGRRAQALLIRQSRFDGDLVLSDDRVPSSSWYGDRQVEALICTGDLQINGDLIDDSSHAKPILIVAGSLHLRSWLRGGMSAFIGADVRASGFVVGHYNDSALMVGGDLKAAGYLPRARPYKDCPHILPHQFGGRIDARELDVGDIDPQGLREHFDPGVLTEEDGEIYLDERAVLSAVRERRPVWRLAADRVEQEQV